MSIESKEDNKSGKRQDAQERSWAERNGGLIFILIIFGLLGLFILYVLLVK